MFTRRQKIMNSFSLDVGHCLATFVILGALQLAILSSAIGRPCLLVAVLVPTCFDTTMARSRGLL